MSLFSKPSGGGGFFKPENYATALALLIETKSFKSNQPHTYQGVQSFRDEATADITVFRSSEALQTGTPSEILKGQQITNTILAADLEAQVGKPFLAVLKKPGRAWVWREVEFEGAEAAVESYYKEREAAVTAAAAAAPSFE